MVSWQRCGAALQKSYLRLFDHEKGYHKSNRIFSNLYGAYLSGKGKPIRVNGRKNENTCEYTRDRTVRIRKSNRKLRFFLRIRKQKHSLLTVLLLGENEYEIEYWIERDLIHPAQLGRMFYLYIVEVVPLCSCITTSIWCRRSLVCIWFWWIKHQT